MQFNFCQFEAIYNEPILIWSYFFKALKGMNLFVKVLKRRVSPQDQIFTTRQNRSFFLVFLNPVENLQQLRVRGRSLEDHWFLETYLLVWKTSPKYYIRQVWHESEEAPVWEAFKTTMTWENLLFFFFFFFFFN